MIEDSFKQLLEKNLETSQESLKILHKINRDRMLGNFFGLVKWVVILAITFGAYYYVEPYLQTSLKVLNNINAGVENVKKTSDALNPNNISSDILKKLAPKQ